MASCPRICSSLHAYAYQPLLVLNLTSHVNALASSALHGNEAWPARPALPFQLRISVLHLSVDAAVQEDFGDQAQQKETMKQLVKGWKVGNFQELLEATPLENIKLSKIYQRCALKAGALSM